MRKLSGKRTHELFCYSTTRTGACSDTLPGLYLGYHAAEGFVIAITDSNGKIVSGVAFKNIEQLNEKWEID